MGAAVLFFFDIDDEIEEGSALRRDWMGYSRANVDDVPLIQGCFNSAEYGLASDLSRAYGVALLHSAAS